MRDARIRLGQTLYGLEEVAVAVSGGVDSLTLAALAGRLLGRDRVLMAHAVSPAVPAEATARVRAMAEVEGWRLDVIEAGEFSDPNYRANPVNRCFYCKMNLYGVIADHTGWQIVSGANVDDLGEYRPGLIAAKEHGVRHPYVEAGMDKMGVRALARDLGLGEVADLPASPCLSSRVETGIRIEPQILALVHSIEQHVGAALRPRTVRCRVRAEGLVIELDAESFNVLRPEAAQALRNEIGVMSGGVQGPVRFAPYRTGSAFLTASR